MIRRSWLLGCSLAWMVGCGGAAADHERLGDEAYAGGRFEEALGEYQTAHRTRPLDRLWAKIGAAALEAKRYTIAATAFLELARAEPDRVAEAAIGLERVAREALRATPVDGDGLRTAVLALREVAPDRPLGRAALATVRSGVLGPREAVSVLPAAVGSAGSGRLVDSLLIAYGDALRATTDCERAVDAYGVVLRRSGSSRGRRVASGGLTACALRLGFDALDGGRPDVAEGWFRDVLRVDSLGAVGLRARVAVGDARLRQGDVLGAMLAYQRAWSVAIETGDPGDSVVTMVRERLNSLRAEDQPPGQGTVP